MHAVMHATGRKFVRFATLSLALAVACVSYARAEAELRWKFKADQSINYEMTMDMTQDMQVGGQQLSTKMSQVMDMTWIVKEIKADGDAVVAQTIDAIKIDITPPNPGAKTISYDSKSEEQTGDAAMLAPIFGGMIGHPITITVSPLGEVKEITIAPAMLESMKKAGPGMGEMFSEDSMKQMVGRSIFTFPPQVAAGQTWDSTLEMKNPILGKQTIVTTYKYAGPEDHDGTKVEKIDVDVKLGFEQSPGAQAKATMKGQSSEGAILFDNQQGLPLETDMTSKMDLQLEIGGQTLDQSITTKVIMVQKKPAPQ